MSEYSAIGFLSIDDLDHLPDDRPERGTQPIALDTTPMKVRGEALHPVLWRGRQWADGGYAIEAKRLTQDIETWGWPAHMAEKDGIDSDEFATAWLVALVLHGKKASTAAIKAALARPQPVTHHTRSIDRDKEILVCVSVLGVS